MAEEAIQTPQGEVGASEGEGQTAPADEKRTSLLGTDTGAETAEGETPDDGVKPVDGEGEDEGTNLKEDEGGEDDKEEPEGAPEQYEPFKMPEGMVLDEAAMEKAAPVFKDLGLSQDQSQKLVDIYAGLVQEEAAKQHSNLNAMRDEWAEEIKSDPNYKQTLAAGKKAVEAFGDDTLKGLLYDNWLGDHPSMVAFLGKIGAAMGNDKLIEGEGSTDTRTRLDRIYSKME